MSNESATNEQWYKRTGIFASGFFMNHLPPEPMKITLRSFKIFAKTCGHICKSRYIATCVNWFQLQIATGINDTNNKFATGVDATSAKNGKQYQTAYTLK